MAWQVFLSSFKKIIIQKLENMQLHFVFLFIIITITIIIIIYLHWMFLLHLLIKIGEYYKRWKSYKNLMTPNFWTAVCVHAIELRFKYKLENKMHQCHQQWEQNVKNTIGFKSLFQAWVGYFNSFESNCSALHSNTLTCYHLAV